MEWHQIVDQVKPYVFKVETPEGFGTGFLFTYAGNNNALCAVATAAHVVEHAERWELPIKITHFASGKSTVLKPDIRAVVVRKELDTAAILFPIRGMELPQELPALIAQERHLKVGVRIGWVGFPALSPDDLCFFRGSVSCWVQEKQVYLVDGVAINGVSGGPAFYYDEIEESLKVAGVISAYAPNRATGETLPGLSVVRSVTQLHGLIQAFRSIEEAKRKEAEQGKTVAPPE
jgi:hypothetical protein